MCEVLNIPTSTYYYQIDLQGKRKPKTEDVKLSAEISRIFKESRNNYGTRKIKYELAHLPEPKIVSRRRIGRLMREMGLISSYTVAQYKVHKTKSNEKPVGNGLDRQFRQDSPLAVVVSDLTYVRVGGKWNYICVFVDLFNREIIGYSAGPNKTAALVYKALASIRANLNDVQMFHTDRGKEFDNKLISEALETFGIQRSLSKKGCPYDNAVAETTFKAIKVEFANKYKFDFLEQLELELMDYIRWFNYERQHGTLDGLSPMKYKKSKVAPKSIV